jgi:hypothetical protein
MNRPALLHLNGELTRSVIEFFKSSYISKSPLKSVELF